MKTLGFSSSYTRAEEMMIVQFCDSEVKFEVGCRWESYSVDLPRSNVQTLSDQLLKWLNTPNT